MQTYNLTTIQEVLTVNKKLDVQRTKAMTLARAERVETSRNTEVVTQEFFNNCTDKETVKFFESIGGRESFQNLCDGSVKCYSYSPNFDGQVQLTIRSFEPIEK